MMDLPTAGVSVVICCYNSAGRLPATFDHLLAQEVPSHLPWEVIIVDNASTDQTADIAYSLWPKNAPAPLRVVKEQQLGLSHARTCGLREARYEFVSFVDDDNWVAPDWVQLVSGIMAANPRVGACGGRTEAVFEITPPEWFEALKHQFAVGTQGHRAGDVTEERGHLWGAGLSLRKSAFQKLVRCGFRHLLKGRTGNALTSGEDYELCYALRLAGWRLWYNPDLQLRHYIPANRLNWDYLRKLNRGHGTSRVGFEPYEFALKAATPNLPLIAGRLWIWQAVKTLGKLVLWHGWDWTRSLWSETEGDIRILYAEHQYGRFVELLNKRQRYDQDVRTVWETALTLRFQ